jgi:beta-aspartyl-peptidase (threonine type)
MQRLPFGVVLHGGAGNLTRYTTTNRLQEAEQFLSALIDDLYHDLDQGASALNVVTKAASALEDSGLFHAGRGSSPNSKGYVELDASIMDGTTLKAGAVAAVRTLRNPIRAARYIMESTSHVLLVGNEADELATVADLDIVDPSWFVPCDVSAGAWEVDDATATGTIGAVALDDKGNLAAATSTGGTLYKRAGRVGDSPIIGAGTYAMDAVAAVSCTGVGEYFIREAAAYQICARMNLLGETVLAATGHVLTRISNLGGTGGIIAIDSRGAFAMPYSTSGMYRAARNSAGRREVACL